MKQRLRIKKSYFTTDKVGIYFVLLLLAVLFFSQRHNYQFDGKVTMNDLTAPVTERSLQEGVIVQQIRWVADVDHIDLMTENKGKTEETVMATLFREDGSRVTNCQIQIPAVKGKQIARVDLQTNEGAEQPGEKKLMRLEIKKVNKKSHIVFYTQPKEIYDNAYATVMIGTNEQLRMDVSYALSKKYNLFYALTGLAFAVGAVIFMHQKKLAIERIFLILVLTAGVILAAVNPACQECDGYEHLVRSMDVSYGNVLSPFVQLTHKSNEVLLPRNFSELRLKGEVSPNSSYASFCYQRQTEEAFNKEASLHPFEEGVNSLFYLPQALGLFVGRTLGFSAYMTMLAARILNLLCYSCLVYFAIKKLPYGKTLFSVIALLPITVYQAASFSPDATLNGFCMLFISTCLAYAYGKTKELGRKEALTLGFLLAIVFLCKYIYVFLGFLVFLIPKERFHTRKDYWKNFIIAFIPIIAAALLVSIGVVNSISQTQSVNELGQTQLEILKGNPAFFGIVLIKTIESKLSFWIEGLATYGWMNYPLGCLVYFTPVLVFVTAFVAPDQMQQKKRGSHIFCMTGTFMAITCMLLLALYVGDGRINPVGASVVEGIQGRYFVPILFLPFFALSNPGVKSKIQQFSNKILGIEMMMLAYSVMQLVEYCY